jgi:hypothetical protein
MLYIPITYPQPLNMGIQGMWLCYGYLRDVVMLWDLRDVVMLWVFKGCSYVMGI